MLNISDIMQTVSMIDHQHLDIRTITLGISLYDCADPDIHTCARKIREKICRKAERLVAVGEEIEREYGIPIINKRISVTPVSQAAASCESDDYAVIGHALDEAAKSCGVNFIGGFSALVHKGFTESDRKLIASIPETLAGTELVCSSVNVATTKAGINMDAVRMMGQVIKSTAGLTADNGGLGCAKLVVFANAVEDNPFMAGAFHGAGEPECVVNVGVSGPGVVWRALQDAFAVVRSPQLTSDNFFSSPPLALSLSEKSCTHAMAKLTVTSSPPLKCSSTWMSPSISSIHLGMGFEALQNR